VIEFSRFQGGERLEEVAIEETIFGDPRFGVRLKRLLDAPDEPMQLQILMEEFTLPELIEIAQMLMRKTPDQHTADERRLTQILAQHGGELEVASLLRIAFA
jgi:hypothetical protein